VADHNIRFYDADPFFILPQTIGSTFSWTGPAGAVGKAAVSDTETGIEGVTLDDDSAGGETATANIDLNGSISTGSNVDAEEVWTVRDTVTGEIFEIASLQVENGAAAGYYTISGIPLVPGRVYEVLAFDSNSDVTAGDIAFDATDYVAPDHAVTCTSSAGGAISVSEDGTEIDFDTGDEDDDDEDGLYNDLIDVTNLTDADGNPVNIWDEVVTDDGSRNAQLTFPNGESHLLTGVAPAEVPGAQNPNPAGMPYFTEGTLIRTEGGEVAVEDLKIEDLVITLDNGPQPIRRIGRRDLGQIDLLACPGQKPIHIPAGVCGNDLPLFVSPQHGIMMDLGQSGGEVLVRAMHLAELRGPVRIAHGKKQVSYFYLMFENHQIIFANGAPSESLYPGDCLPALSTDEHLGTQHEIAPDLDVLTVTEANDMTVRRYLTRKQALTCVDLRPTATAEFAA